MNTQILVREHEEKTFTSNNKIVPAIEPPSAPAASVGDEEGTNVELGGMVELETTGCKVGACVGNEGEAEGANWLVGCVKTCRLAYLVYIQFQFLTKMRTYQ